jgi:hypothetical protein
MRRHDDSLSDPPELNPLSLSRRPWGARNVGSCSATLFVSCIRHKADMRDAFIDVRFWG